MVAGFHLIWTAYGWWLPNDPRGSSSQVIRVEKIAGLGDLHPGRKAVQPPSQEIQQFYHSPQHGQTWGTSTDSVAEYLVDS